MTVTITQEDIVNQIATKEDIDVATVRNVFKSAENIIFDYLSSTSPSECVVLKPFHGFSVEGKYIPERIIHTYDNFVSKARIRVRPKVTRYYNKKVNKYFNN